MTLGKLFRSSESLRRPSRRRSSSASQHPGSQKPSTSVTPPSTPPPPTLHKRQDSGCSTCSSTTSETLANLAIYTRSPKQALYVLHRLKELKRAAARLAADDDKLQTFPPSNGPSASISPLSNRLSNSSSTTTSSSSSSSSRTSTDSAYLTYAKYILSHAHRLEFDRHIWLQEAIDILKHLASKHIPAAQALYADLLTDGPPSCTNEDPSIPLLLQRDNEGAFRLYRKAAAAGIPDAAYRAAMMIRDRRVPWGGDTKTESDKLLRAAAKEKHPAALQVLAQDLLTPRQKSSKADLERGLRFLVDAAHNATKQYPQPLHDLALIYDRGVPELAIQPDPDSALNLLLDAADMGYAPAMHTLGKRYAADSTSSTPHTENNQAQMVHYLSGAAALAHPPSQLALSKLYLTGVPAAKLPRDPAQAFILARAAALAGNPAAMCVVAIFVANQHVVRCADPQREARMWLTRAVQAGSQTAQRHLSRLDSTGAL